MDEVYLISATGGNQLSTEVVVLAHRLDGHRVGLYPGRGVADIVGSLDAEIVSLVRLAQEYGLGLGGGFVLRPVRRVSQPVQVPPAPALYWTS